ncbi:MAG: hypothetical protein IJ806_08235 [Ruminococcus sp.]|nr:hypothetical protein [Ruminococcus sp.]
MDIISEILETDRQAEEKLEEARNKRSELLKNAEIRAQEIKDKAKAEAEAYRRQRLESAGDAGEKGTDSPEDRRIEEFKALYEKEHGRWEKEIFDAVISGS